MPTFYSHVSTVRYSTKGYVMHKTHNTLVKSVIVLYILCSTYPYAFMPIWTDLAANNIVHITTHHDIMQYHY